MRANENNSTELDCWFSACMKIESLNDFMSMRDIFHELVLNGCKFSNYLFNLIDSMSELKQFKFDANTRGANDNDTNKPMSTFSYNSYMSYFIKSLAFICNYNLEKLFNNSNQCELFLKSIFVKLNELLLANEQLLASTETAIDNLGWFKCDMKKFLISLHVNNLGFKYFSDKKFFNFLRRKHSIYNFILKYLYSYNDVNSSMHLHSSHACEQQIDPLKLADLSKLKIKSTLAYLDMTLINRLRMPKLVNQFVGAELSQGLGKSYERTKINKKFGK